MQSLGFDRAADFYDQTRALPLEVVRAFRAAVLAEAGVRTNTRFLDLGIGTGRIAAPFLQAGDWVVGLDLSAAMMARVRARFPAAALVEADAAVLPLASGSVDVVIAVHVWHVVARWRALLMEARRVLRTDGVLIWSWHWRARGSLNAVLRAKLAALAGDAGFSTRRPGASGPIEVERALATLGARQREVEVARWQRRNVSVKGELAALAARQTSDTWSLPDGVLKTILRELERWALAEYGSLDYSEPLQERMSLRAARF